MPKSATVNRPTPFKESSDKAVAQNAKQIVWVSIYEDSKSSSATTDRMRQMAAKVTQVPTLVASLLTQGLGFNRASIFKKRGF